MLAFGGKVTTLVWAFQPIVKATTIFGLCLTIETATMSTYGYMHEWRRRS